MKNEIFFIILSCFCFLLFSVGLELASWSLLSKNAIVMGLYFPVGVSLCLLTGIILNYLISYTFTIETTDERDIEKEKSLLGKFVLWGTILILFAASLILYLFVVLSVKIQPVFQIYMVVFASATIGAFWAVGLQDVWSFRSWSKYGRNFEDTFNWTDESYNAWYQLRETFLDNLIFWKKRFIFSYSTFIVVVSIMYILIYNKII